VGDSTAKRGPILLILAISIALVAVGAALVWRAAREPLFDEPGTFVLDPRDGHPMACSSGKRVHFGWDGKVLAVTPGPVPLGRHQSDFKRYTEPISTVQLADRQIEVDGNVITTALSPTAPDGGKRCLAVTVEKKAQPGSPAAVGNSAEPAGSDQGVQYFGYVFDYVSGEQLLGEELFPLSCYQNGQMPREICLLDAEIVKANAGPDGGIGLAIEFSFARDDWQDGQLVKNGLFSRNGWRPSSVVMHTPRTFPDAHEIYVGPGNRYIWCTGHGSSRLDLQFFDATGGRPVNQKISFGSDPKLRSIYLAGIWHWTAGGFLLSLAIVAILALGWHFLLPRRTG
jgi:hypothetical protein